MDREHEVRRREFDLLMGRAQSDIDDARAAINGAHDAVSLVESMSVESAALRTLENLARSQRSITEASRSLALALTDRGTSTAKVARALGVSRGTVLNWREKRENGE